MKIIKGNSVRQYAVLIQNSVWRRRQPLAENSAITTATVTSTTVVDDTKTFWSTGLRAKSTQPCSRTGSCDMDLIYRRVLSQASLMASMATRATLFVVLHNSSVLIININCIVVNFAVVSSRKRPRAEPDPPCSACHSLHS